MEHNSIAALALALDEIEFGYVSFSTDAVRGPAMSGDKPACSDGEIWLRKQLQGLTVPKRERLNRDLEAARCFAAVAQIWRYGTGKRNRLMVETLKALVPDLWERFDDDKFRHPAMWVLMDAQRRASKAWSAEVARLRAKAAGGAR